MEEFIINYGILAVALLLFIDDLGVPLPGTTIIFTSAILASQSPEINILYLFIVALFIPPLANMILFYFSRHGLRDWLDAHGHKVFLSQKRINKAQKIFDNYGEITVFFAAMITSVRAVSSIIAGGLKMNGLKFMIYHFLGVLVWASVVIGTGYFFGNHIWEILRTKWEIIILLIFLILAGKAFWNFSKK